MKWLTNLFKRKPVLKISDVMGLPVEGAMGLKAADIRFNRSLTDEQAKEVTDYLCDKYQIERNEK